MLRQKALAIPVVVAALVLGGAGLGPASARAIGTRPTSPTKAVPTAVAGPSVIAYADSYGAIGVVRAGHMDSATTLYQLVPPEEDGSPSWSPNGQTLAFAVAETSFSGIVLVNRNGQVLHIFKGLQPFWKNFSASLDWSPDGTQIAYICNEGKILTKPGETPYTPEYFSNVCVLDVATGAHRVLAESTDSLGLPRDSTGGGLSWSPRGDVIAVGASQDEGACSTHVPPGCAPQCVSIPGTPLSDEYCSLNKIALVDVFTDRMTVMADSPIAVDPEFSPNGFDIAFIDATWGVDVMSASGTDIRNIVPASDLPADPNWSPDGEEIVFASQMSPADNGNYDLFTVSAHGGSATQATDTPNPNFDPSWAPAVTVCSVPNLIGQTLAAATTLVKRAGCALGTVSGPTKNRKLLHVVSQKPAAHQVVASGTKVNVKLG